MKNFSGPLGTTASLFLVVALSACGGGDGAPPTVTPVAKNPTVFGQNDAKAIARLGLATSQLMLIQTLLEQEYIGGLFQSLTTASANGSLSPTSSSCASATGGSGSFTLSQVKAGTYVGYKINDSIEITYNACKFATSSIVINGKFSLVSLGNYANLSAISVVDYRLSTTNFEINSSALRFRSSGIQAARYDTTTSGAGAADVTVSVQSGRSVELFSSATATTPVVTWTISPSAAVKAKLTSANFTFSMNGDISTATASGGGPLSFTTITPLTGPYSTSALYPTSGIMRVKEPAVNLLTETTYQGSTATVKADTNRDGVLDLTFITTAQELGTP